MKFNELDFDRIELKPVKSKKRKKLDTLAKVLNREYDELVKELKAKKEIKEIISFSINQQKNEKQQKERAYEEKKHYYSSTEEEKKPKFNLQNYYTTNLNKNKAYNYFSTGAYSIPGINIVRVPSSMLGQNALGCAFLGRNLIYIREDLHGNDFEEVKKHEVNHIIYPHLSEWQIRDKTRAELPFYGKYH